MVTATSVPPVITPGAQAGRLFFYIKQTVSLRSFVATTLDALLSGAGESKCRRILQVDRSFHLIARDVGGNVCLDRVIRNVQ